MPDHNRQTNVHLVGNPEEGVLSAIVNKLDCNTFESDNLRRRLDWLIHHANLVILLPGWKDTSTCLLEVATAAELGIKTVFLHEVLPEQPKARVLIEDVIEHFAKLGLEVRIVDLDPKLWPARG